MTSASIYRRIAESDFFAGMAPEQIDFLATHARMRQLSEGEVLFHYGDRADHFYLVLEGHIVVEVAAIEGPALELQDLGPGVVVGWSWLIAPHTSSFQDRARSAAPVLEFDGKAVLARCEENSRFGYDLLKRFSALMSERLHAARQSMMEAWQPRGFA